MWDRQTAAADMLHPRGGCLYLDGLARVQVLTLVGALQHVGQHDSLHMRPGQLQQVVQALVPGLEGA